MQRILILLSVLAATTACETITPRISHVHVGHAITGWIDTPDQKGLFVTAEQKADTAAKQAALATQSKNLATIKKNVSAVTHAIDPKGKKTGSGGGYGMKKALRSARQHIQFAATSKDTSPNIKRGAQAFARNSAIVLERGDTIVALAEVVQQSRSATEAAALAGEIHTLAVQNLLGEDSNKDGRIASPKEYGLKQLRRDLEAMANSESPPYQPILRKYLFGLVRLPSGEWAFKSSGADYSSYGSGRY